MATNDIAGAVLDAHRPRRAAGELAAGISRNLQAITAFFLFLFVVAQPLSIAASHVAYAGAALAWVLRLALVRRGALKSSPLDLPILIYLLLCTLSTLLSPLPASSAYRPVRRRKPPAARAALCSVLRTAAAIEIPWEWDRAHPEGVLR